MVIVLMPLHSLAAGTQQAAQRADTQLSATKPSTVITLDAAAGIPSQIVEVFPKCDRLTGVGDNGWIAVMHGKKLLGYVAYSKPASNGITGFKGETPLLLCFNTRQEIIAVELLDNHETPSFVSRVKSGGLFDAWDGLTVAKAMKKTPDAVSGATYTSHSVIASMQMILQQLSIASPAPAKSTGNAAQIILPMAALAVILLLLSRKKKRPSTTDGQNTTE